jgi:hypothetical protein
MTDTRNAILTEHQRLPTSGARAVEPFEIDGTLYLAVPQLAQDIPGQPAQMNGGDSDVDMILYRWRDGRFEEERRLPLPGGEDVLFFEIGGERFLATAGVRTGRGPYDLNTNADLYRRQGDAWIKFQSLPAFAAKQWYRFDIGERHFLALAQGVTMDGVEARNPRRSMIFEWDGSRFVEFQTLDGAWGYNFVSFAIDGQHFLGYADHVSATGLFRWDGTRFEHFQDLVDHGGRAFQFFEADGHAWLAVAAVLGDTVLFHWDGGRFAQHQTLGGPGGRELKLIHSKGSLHLVRICLIQGTPAAPRSDLRSQLYRWEGGQFVLVEEFSTFGGTDAATFERDGQLYLAVANSLSAEIRFRQDSVIYRVDL